MTAQFETMGAFGKLKQQNDMVVGCGNPAPSSFDIDATRFIADDFDAAGIQLNGHVIINHNRYTAMSRDGDYTVQSHAFQNTYDLPKSNPLSVTVARSTKAIRTSHSAVRRNRKRPASMPT